MQQFELQIVHCSRCNAPCRRSAPPNPKARLLKRSDVPSGLCASCATAQFLQNSPMAQLITNPEMLLNPTLREQFARIMEAGNADANPAEINWEKVVRDWALPFPGTQRKSRRKQ